MVVANRYGIGNLGVPYMGIENVFYSRHQKAYNSPVASSKSSIKFLTHSIGGAA